MRSNILKMAVAVSAAVALPALADANCVLQTNTIRTAAAVSERDSVRADIVTMPGNQRKCVVSFKARVGTEWYQAYGEARWDGSSAREEACARAVKVAEEELVTRLAPHELRAESMMICSDAPSAATLADAKVGTVGPNSQFRGHPQYPGHFWHNGTRCRWFLDSQFENSRVRTYQGIVCEVSEGWVVVDKF